MTDMHPEDIKAEIRKAGGTISSVARDAGVSAAAISGAIERRTSERLEAVIADFIGMQATTIWPSRYDKTGVRIRFHRNTEQVAA